MEVQGCSYFSNFGRSVGINQIFNSRTKRPVPQGRFLNRGDRRLSTSVVLRVKRQFAGVVHLFKEKSVCVLSMFNFSNKLPTYVQDTNVKIGSESFRARELEHWTIQTIAPPG